MQQIRTKEFILGKQLYYKIYFLLFWRRSFWLLILPFGLILEDVKKHSDFDINRIGYLLIIPVALVLAPIYQARRFSSVPAYQHFFEGARITFDGEEFRQYTVNGETRKVSIEEIIHVRKMFKSIVIMISNNQAYIIPNWAFYTDSDRINLEAFFKDKGLLRG